MMGTRAVLCNCTVSYRVILQDVQLVNNFVVQVSWGRVSYSCVTWRDA